MSLGLLLSWAARSSKSSGIRSWLRQQAVVPEPERKEFWDKLERKRQKYAEDPDAPAPPSRYRQVLLASLPPGSEEPEIWHRRAGLGSLGRPRWVARAVWRGGLVVREAKAVIPSAWTRVDAGGDRTSHAQAAARAQAHVRRLDAV